MPNAISYFDRKTLAYTYENNGWAFSNLFEGTTRITEMASRGTLRETVNVAELREGVFMIAWEDAEMGIITQVVDLPNQRILAAVPWNNTVEIWPARITHFG